MTAATEMTEVTLCANWAPGSERAPWLICPLAAMTEEASAIVVTVEDSAIVGTEEDSAIEVIEGIEGIAEGSAKAAEGLVRVVPTKENPLVTSTTWIGTPARALCHLFPSPSVLDLGRAAALRPTTASAPSRSAGNVASAAHPLPPGVKVARRDRDHPAANSETAPSELNDLTVLTAPSGTLPLLNLITSGATT